MPAKKRKRTTTRRRSVRPRGAATHEEDGLGIKDFLSRMSLSDLFREAERAEQEEQAEKRASRVKQLEQALDSLRAEIYVQNQRLTQQIVELQAAIQGTKLPASSLDPDTHSPVSAALEVHGKRYSEEAVRECKIVFHLTPPAGAASVSNNRAFANELFRRLSSAAEARSLSSHEKFYRIAVALRDTFLEFASEEESVLHSAEIVGGSGTQQETKVDTAESQPVVSAAESDLYPVALEPVAQNRDYIERIEPALQIRKLRQKSDQAIKILNELKTLESIESDVVSLVYLKCLAGCNWDEIALWTGKTEASIRSRVLSVSSKLEQAY